MPFVFCLWSCALSAGMGLNAIEDVFGERREKVLLGRQRPRPDLCLFTAHTQAGYDHSVS